MHILLKSLGALRACTLLIYSLIVICTSGIALFIYYPTEIAHKCSPVSNWLQIQCLLSILTLVLFLIVYDTWLLVSPSFPNVFFFLFSLIFILFTGFTCSSYSSVELFSKVLCLVSLVSISSLSMIFSINYPNVDIFKYDSSSSLGTENTLITAYQNLAHRCLTSTLNAWYSHYYHPHTCLFSDLWMTELPLCPFSPFHFSILFLISTFSPFASLIIT